jgi:predicted amidohydrolase YtcJ
LDFWFVFLTFFPEMSVFLGRVATLDERIPFAFGVATKEGRVVALLTEQSKEDNFVSLWSKNKVVVRFRGVMFPGFVDPHSHLLATGRSMMCCSLQGCENIAQVIVVWLNVFAINLWFVCN